MWKLACVGECMIELAVDPDHPGWLKQAFAGDTYNVAYYLRALTPTDAAQVDYITAIGNDVFSKSMLAQWQQQNIGIEQVYQHPQALPGIYSIWNDEDGERHFSYWRSQSAATQLFADEQRVSQIPWTSYDHIYLSGITLAITPEIHRSRLIQVLEDAHAGAETPPITWFDLNYRPRLWKNLDDGRMWFERILEHIDVLLISVEDYELLYGDQTLEAVIERIRNQRGGKETVITQGAKGCVVVNGEETIAVPPLVAENVVDTTSAGDSFTAGYWAARLEGQSIEAAINRGQQVAVRVIGYRGAIIPPELIRGL